MLKAGSSLAQVLRLLRFFFAPAHADRRTACRRRRSHSVTCRARLFSYASESDTITSSFIRLSFWAFREERSSAKPETAKLSFSFSLSISRVTFVFAWLTIFVPPFFRRGRRPNSNSIGQVWTARDKFLLIIKTFVFIKLLK